MESFGITIALIVAQCVTIVSLVRIVLKHRDEGGLRARIDRMEERVDYIAQVLNLPRLP